MSLYPDKAVGDSAFLGVPLGSKPPGAVGTAGTSIAAIEIGDAMQRRTILKVTAPIAVCSTPNGESLGGGALIYTFPAGQVIVHEVYGDMGLEIDDAALVGDTPEVGLGTVIGTGAIATLGAAVTTMENLWGPHVAAGCDVGAAATDAGQFVSRPGFVILAAAAHLVHFNVADGWAGGGGNDKDVYLNQGRFIIDWSLIPTEGL